jgi:L-threonine kinase
MQQNRSLYRDFPVEIRLPYQGIVQIQDWSGRHMRLLDFAETALRYLASLSLSDYRSRCRSPNRKVEGMLEKLGSRNLTFGRHLELFRISAAAIPDPLIPPPERSPVTQMESLRRFGAALDALEAAVAGLSPGTSSSAIGVAVHVQRGLAGEAPNLDWWGGWERLVWYRNQVFHAGANNWPVHNEGYGEIMGPLLHDALVDLLTQPTVAEVILAHPVASVTLIEPHVSGGFANWMCGEERGDWFEKEIVTEAPVTDRWTAEHWRATTASSYILSAVDGWSVRGLFWDLRNGLPPVMHMRVPDVTAAPGKPPNQAPRRSRLSAAREGRGTAPGTCGEFVQGILADGTPFHVTCPINKSATVVAKLTPAEKPLVLGLSEHHRKLGLAIDHTIELLGLGTVEVVVRHWSDLDIAKGMGSSTADVLSGIRAIAAAAGEELDIVTQGELAARVESSDGSMYPGIAAVNHKTCELVKAWDWYPEFVIVMLVPEDIVNTPSISFTGQEALAREYQTLLERMSRAIAERSIADFARESTRSAIMNNRFLLNPFSSKLSDRLEEFGALGINVGHTGTVCGLLFPNTEDGRVKASDAYLEMRRLFPDLKDVKVVTTPHCEAASCSREGGGETDEARNGQ